MTTRGPASSLLFAPGRRAGGLALVLGVLAAGVAAGTAYRQGLHWLLPRAHVVMGVFLGGLSDELRTWEVDLVRSLRPAPGAAEARALRDQLGADAPEPTASSPSCGLPTRSGFAPQGFVGLYDGEMPGSLRGVEEVVSTTGIRPQLLAWYQAWGDGPDAAFPRRACELAHELGAVPLITWEPWVTAFAADRTDLPPPAERDHRNLRAIADGTYDFHLRAWAAEAAAWDRPIFLRFAHEMNNVQRYPWTAANDNTPDDFIAAWWHVQEVFAEEGADQIVWVWSPHAARKDRMAWYPGDDSVDWIGTVVLNYGTAPDWSSWWSFDEIFSAAHDEFAPTGKPLLIAEMATLAEGGDPAAWYGDAFAALRRRYPRVLAVVLFHDRHDATVTSWPLNWSFVDQGTGVADAVAELARDFATPPEINDRRR